MSTMSLCTCKCAVCGAESEQDVLTSANAFGSPDLDLRPSEMARSTMSFWIGECPHCGYIASSIEAETKISKDFLQSVEYRSCSGIDFKSPLATKFYKSYLISLSLENHEDAFYDSLHAAWSCDDVGDFTNGIHCRKLALAELDKLLAQNGNDTMRVQKADLLRRAGLFDAVIAQYSDIHFESDDLNKIIAFQIERAKQKDICCYTVADVLE
ncbi:MAG: hypothetical protein E7448_07330 [Ruminococcaceae bacterium]|nr:hypothetical protein [Oscillospiraceae bacterium]